MVNIEGLNKAEILRRLYNNSRPIGLGFLQYDPKDMTLEEAEEILAQLTDFDYLKGRVIKVDLTSDVEFREWLYDRDNGEGAAQRVVDSIRNK
jgi:hypothetical protein